MQPGSLRKVSGGWGYRLDVGIEAESGGRRQVAQQGFATKREAQVTFEDVIARLRGGAVLRRTQMAVGEFLDQWLEGERVNLRQSTWYSYEVGCSESSRTSGDEASEPDASDGPAVARGAARVGWQRPSPARSEDGTQHACRASPSADDDAPPEAKAGEFAGLDAFVGRRARDAE